MGLSCYYILVICLWFLATVHGLPVFENHKIFRGDIQQEVLQVPRAKTELSLNKALSMDSDEDLFFDQFWLEEDEDDAYDFIYNFFEEEEAYNSKPSIMLVSSSSDDHVIELALMATTMVVASVDQDDDQDDFDMTSET